MKPVALRLTVPAFLLIIALPAFCLPAFLKTEGMAARTALIMGTIVEIKAPVTEGSKRRDIEAGIEKALEEVRRVEGLFSAFREESEVSKINRLKKGEALRIGGEAFSLIEKALAFSKATGGAFDITVKPLVDLWAEARKDGRIPPDAEVKAAVERTGWTHVVLDKAAGTLTLDKEGMAIDLGAIAKGYAADRAAAVLRASGIGNAIVDCGGDMYCLGRRSDSEKWKVGIRDPRNKEKIFLELRLQDKAIDTSGDYEKFFISGGRRYSHIIDPRTGYPVGDSVASASVIADDSVTADALATALCVMGKDGMKTLSRFGGTDAVMVIMEKGKPEVLMSGGFKERYDAVETEKLR